MNQKLQRAGSWFDELIPPAFQGWVRVAVIIILIRWAGIDLSPVNALIKDLGGQVEEAKAIGVSNAVTLDNLEETLTTVLDRQYAERRKGWTLSNDLQRIEGKIDRLLGGE